MHALAPSQPNADIDENTHSVRVPLVLISVSNNPFSYTFIVPRRFQALGDKLAELEDIYVISATEGTKVHGRILNLRDILASPLPFANLETITSENSSTPFTYVASTRDTMIIDNNGLGHAVIVLNTGFLGSAFPMVYVNREWIDALYIKHPRPFSKIMRNRPLEERLNMGVFQVEQVRQKFEAELGRSVDSFIPDFALPSDDLLRPEHRDANLIDMAYFTR